jgi:patatin-like phospholipase/acyl hydrolase
VASAGSTREPISAQFRILIIDGGGIRGLIPALLIQELETRLRARRPGAQIADYFHLFAGTSTGGLIALGLTAPDDEPGRARMDAAKLVALYRKRGPAIFARSGAQRLRTLWGWTGPKYTLEALRAALDEELGPARLSQALRELVVVGYDMTKPGPKFFKRWRAIASADRDVPLAEAGLATAAAPTYFPSVELKDAALVDGGVFAANPTIAAIVEALKRTTDAPAPVSPHQMLVVALGTGAHPTHYEQSEVRGWGRLGWVWPRPSGPPLLEAIFDGQTAAANHWAHMLLNHDPGDTPDEVIGAGPRYYRFQPELRAPLAMDDAGPAALAELTSTAEALIEASDQQLVEIVELLDERGPLPPD